MRELKTSNPIFKTGHYASIVPEENAIKVQLKRVIAIVKRASKLRACSLSTATHRVLLVAPYSAKVTLGLEYCYIEPSFPQDLGCDYPTRSAADDGDSPPRLDDRHTASHTGTAHDGTDIEAYVT